MITHRRDHDLLLVDMGGVFFDFSFEQSIARWVELSDRPAGDLSARWRIDAEFDAFERGQLAPGDYLAHLRRVLDVELSPAELADGWNSIYGDVNAELVSLLRGQPGRTPIIGVSNTNALHAPVWRARYTEHLDVFDAVFCSHEMGCTKPGREFFTLVADRYGVGLEQMLLVDDIPAIVSAAEALGIRGHHYRSVPELREVLLGGAIR